MSTASMEGLAPSWALPQTPLGATSPRPPDPSRGPTGTDQEESTLDERR